MMTAAQFLEGCHPYIFAASVWHVLSSSGAKRKYLIFICLPMTWNDEEYWSLRKHDCKNGILKWNFSTTPPPSNSIFKRVGTGRDVYSDSEDLCVGVTLPEVVCDLTVQDHHESFIISRIDRKWNSNVRLLRGPWPQCAFRQSKRSKTIAQLPKKQFGDWFTLLIVSRVCK